MESITGLINVINRQTAPFFTLTVAFLEQLLQYRPDIRTSPRLVGFVYSSLLKWVKRFGSKVRVLDLCGYADIVSLKCFRLCAVRGMFEKCYDVFA